jgi:hypothetical protein
MDILGYVGSRIEDIMDRNIHHLPPIVKKLFDECIQDFSGEAHDAIGFWIVVIGFVQLHVWRQHY